MSTNITYEDQQLIAIYNSEGTRIGVITALEAMRQELGNEDAELLALTDSAIGKLKEMSDTDFDSLELIPDFTEDEDAG